MDVNSINLMIDAQINEIKENATLPGWSIWAVVLVIFAILYSLFKSIALYSGSWNVISLLAFSLYNILYLFLSLIRFDYSIIPYSKTIFVKSSNILLSTSKRILIVELVYSLLILFIGNKFGNNTILKVSINIIYGLMLILYICGLILTFVEWPNVTTNQKENNGTKIFAIIIKYIPIVISIFIFFNLEFDLTKNLKEIEIAILLSTAFILFYLFIKLTISNPLLSNLSQIRKDLAFGFITVDEANSRLEIVTYGMRLNKVIENELSSSLDNMHNPEFKVEVQRRGDVVE